MGVGDGGPHVSPDGAFIAYGREGRLWLCATAGARPVEQITRFDKGDVTLLIGGFSPDGKLLLFHQGAVSREDDELPLPPGLRPGFYLLQMADRRVVPAPRLGAFDAWDADGEHVLFNEHRADGAALMRAPALGGDARVLLETRSRWGFGQITSRGDFLTYLGEHQLMRARIDGSGLAPVTPKGTAAEYQWPTPAPGGAHVAYVHRTGRAPNDLTSQLEIAAAPSGAITVLRPCRKGCQLGWESATRLLVRDGDELHRLSLDGTGVLLEKGVRELLLPDP